MIARLILVFAIVSAPLLASPVHAQSPLDFLRKQHRKEERRQRPPPPPPPVVETAPTEAQPGAPATVIGTENAAPGTAAPTPSVVVKNTPPAPYEKDMRRLSEILGALHYLRPLCGAQDGPIWRDKMRELMDAEGGPPDRRERLAGAFNDGYSGFQLTYRTCTPSADLAVRRFLEEGSKLTREIATRHGG
jgi:uncharacterized protein (TIGR02301 family)